jgi:hypothetical protein
MTFLSSTIPYLSSTIPYRHVQIQDRRASSDFAFGVWASIVLIGLAIISVALGTAPIADPAIFILP